MQAISMCIMHIELPVEEEVMNESLKWRTDSREKSYTCAIFSVNSVERTAHDGRHGTFVEIESPDWIVAIPWVMVDGVPCFIMEEQYRHGSDSITREFPAGLVEKGEPAIEAARRELLEETGMQGDFIELGNVCPNSAFMSNRQSFFLVTGIEKVSGQSLDANEEIDVVTVPVEEAIRDMGKGAYDNGIMMMAIGFFLRYAESHSELKLRQPRTESV